MSPDRPKIRPVSALMPLSALLLATSLLSACADEPAPQQPTFELHFASLEAGGCEPSPNGTGKVPADVTTLSAVIEIGNSVSDPQRIAASKLESGRWVIGPLPIADSADVVMYGCDAAGKVVYQGRSNNTPIPDQAESIVRMFLVPVGKLACTGHKAVNTGKGQSNHLQAARSFAASTALPSGDVLVTGGIGSWDGDAKKGVGSLDTDVYEHDGGHFHKGPAMLEKRIWHHAVALDNSMVLVVGGVSEVEAVGALPSPLMAPTDFSAALPKNKAELLDLTQDAAGAYPAAKAATVDVGAGATFMSSAIKVGDSVLFAGGIEAGKAQRKVTRVSGLADVAAGKSGTSASFDLTLARIRPGLAAFADGAVVVWGGATEGKNAAAELGELIAKGGDKAQPITITGGPKALFDDPMLGTFAPSVARLKEDGGKLVLIVAGGMPQKAPTNATAVPSYLAVVGSDAKAEIKQIDLGGKALHAGLGAAALQLKTGHALIAGGLIGLSGVKPCEASAPECLMATATLITPPDSTDGDTVTLTVASVDLGGPRAGVSAAVLPAGALLAGGQGTVTKAEDKGTAALEPSGRVVAGSLSASDEKKICP